MARTRKFVSALNLYKYDVLIEDRATRSDYFKITQFDGYFYGGRNAFLIAGNTTLKPNSKILVEILNVNGETIYSAPVTNFVEGSSRLVQVEVYSDTPPGPGKLVILGSTDSYLDGTPIPKEWEDKYNVRWITDIIISPQVRNKTSIRFLNSPVVSVEEKFYAIPATASFTQTATVPFGDYELIPTKYNNILQTGYLIKLKNPTTENIFKSEHLNNGRFSTYAVISGSSEFIFGSVPITRIFNETTAFGIPGGFLSSSLKTKILSGFISGAGFDYSTTIEPYGPITVFSSINTIRYNKLIESDDTLFSNSYAKLRISNLNTISGEINKIRVFYKSTTNPGDYVLLADVPAQVEELLTTDVDGKILNISKFDKPNTLQYWYAATMSIGQESLTDGLPDYYKDSSIYTNLSLVQSSKKILDAITTVPEISSSITTYKDNVSYFIGNIKESNFQLFPNSEYTLKFDAMASNTSASIQLNQDTYDMEVYLVSSSGLLDTNPRGQLLGKLSYDRQSGDQLFEQIEFNFVPKIITPSTVGLRFVIYGGFWDVANISLKPAEEEFFSTDEVSLLIPIQNIEKNILTFKTEFLDLDNNSVEVSAISTPKYFTGSSDYVKKVGDYMTGELYIKGLPIQNQALQDGFTGLVSGGLITVNTPASWSYTISSGSGYVIDNYTDPLDPKYTYVTWPQITKMPGSFISTGSVATTPRTNIAISSSGEVIEQSNEWTPVDYRKYIILGRIAHVGTTFIQRALSLPLTTYNRGFHWFDLANAIGIINVEGNVYYPSGSSMSIGKTEGKTYRVGSNYRNDTTYPDITSDPSSLPTVFAYRYRSGSGFAELPLTTHITGALYDNGSGILQTPNPNKFTVQRIYYFGATNTTRIQFGQNVYDTIEDAQFAATSEQFTADPNLERDSSLRTYLVVGTSATNLSNPLEAEFITVGKFGNAGGGGAGGAANLSDLNDVSLSSLQLGNLLQYNGTTWINSSTASFSTSASWAPAITSITAGSGLNGGTITKIGTVSLNTESVHFLDGVKKELNAEGVISSSTQAITWTVASASVAATAVTASGLSGGTTNYIPLWSSGTVQSSSNIFQSSGNIGIGSTSPTGKLYIGPTWRTTNGGSALYVGGTTGINNTTDLGITYVVSSSNTASPATVGLTLYNNDTTVGGWSPMLLFSKAESGASPFKATMAGIAAKSPLGTGNGDAWIDGELHFYTAGAATLGIVNRMIIDKEGRVGIGTTSPTTPLQVAGNVSASSYTSSLSNAIGYFGTASWAVNATTASFAPIATGASASIALFNTNTTVSSSLITQRNGIIAIAGSANVTGSLDVTTSFSAQTKSFKIAHQTQIGKSLVYGVLEGAEHAVYARGKLVDNNTITLPDEWNWLVDEESITVQLTPIGSHQKLYVKNIDGLVITVGNENLLSKNIQCYYLVHATRKDVPQLQTVV
jgi:hypothetical protein